MPRRKSEPSLLEVALRGTWKFSAALGASSLVLGFVIIPAVLGSNQLLRPLASVVATLSLLPAAIFGLIAVVKFLRQSNVQPVRNVTPPWSRTQFGGHQKNDDQGLTQGVARPPGFERLPRTEPHIRSKPSEWSLEVLRSIEWKRFEEVVAAYFREKNFRCETIRCGADGGIDAKLFFGDLPDPVGIVQCKAWTSRQVGVAPIRELLGVMAHEKVSRGYFAATGEYTREAIEFARSNPIMLIAGTDFFAAIRRMPKEAQERLLDVSTEGDYTTPTCPSCGIKLVERTNVRGSFWGCRNFPRCRTRIAMRPINRT